MKERIGFIGVGLMGNPLARNLVSAGYSVIAHDIDPEKVEAIVSAGGKRVASPADIPSQVDVIILSLVSAEAVDDVVRNSVIDVKHLVLRGLRREVGDQILQAVERGGVVRGDHEAAALIDLDGDGRFGGLFVRSFGLDFRLGLGSRCEEAEGRLGVRGGYGSAGRLFVVLFFAVGLVVGLVGRLIVL